MNPFRTIKDFIESGGGAGKKKKKIKPEEKPKDKMDTSPKTSIRTLKDYNKKRKAILDQL